ncbi:hypothetical protein B296_00025132 [Ensete ventricosum]|uniref:Uncharacterized protein n=1 Tax=Ensete ventricosum TaxID=4639 RepID=A0A426Y0R2_ENSVE|nr:hypothetical protein B296_00025132 [Ensete ventricosum]
MRSSSSCTTTVAALCLPCHRCYHATVSLSLACSQRCCPYLLPLLPAIAAQRVILLPLLHAPVSPLPQWIRCPFFISNRSNDLCSPGGTICRFSCEETKHLPFVKSTAQLSLLLLVKPLSIPTFFSSLAAAGTRCRFQPVFFTVAFFLHYCRPPPCEAPSFFIAAKPSSAAASASFAFFFPLPRDRLYRSQALLYRTCSCHQ